MNFIKPLFSLSYWFSYYATPFSPWASKGILVLMALSAIVAIALWIWKGRMKDMALRHAAGRMAACAMTASLSGLFLWFVNYEGVPLLSMRAFWLVWLVIFGWWKWSIYRRYQQDVSDMTMSHDPERAAYEKYLPKPKGR
ncbi:MAG: hypothetical protein U0487_02860, partial [Patescibacteria group bacterium]